MRSPKSQINFGTVATMLWGAVQVVPRVVDQEAAA
jgi:hypothetical protein